MAEHDAGARPPGHEDIWFERKEQEPRLFALLDHGFDGVERILIYIVSLILIGLAVVSVVNTVVVVWSPIFTEHDYNKAISVGFDAAFLTIILLEVLHTVLSRSSLVQQVQEFLVIGITSAVRHSLGVAATAGSTHQEFRTVCNTVRTLGKDLQQQCHVIVIDVPNGNSQEVVIELAVNAGAVLLLVAALWLVRQSTTHTNEAPH